MMEHRRWKLEDKPAASEGTSTSSQQDYCVPPTFSDIFTQASTFSLARGRRCNGLLSEGSLSCAFAQESSVWCRGRLTALLELHSRDHHMSFNPNGGAPPPPMGLHAPPSGLSPALSVQTSVHSTGAAAAVQSPSFTMTPAAHNPPAGLFAPGDFERAIQAARQKAASMSQQMGQPMAGGMPAGGIYGGLPNTSARHHLRRRRRRHRHHRACVVLPV